MLLSETIGIRRYREGDAAALFEAATESRRELGPWMPWCHDDYSLADSEAFVQRAITWWESGEAYSFAIFERDGDRYLGGTGINFIHPVHRFANLGYWVRSSANGRGVAAAAGRLVARFGLEDLGLHRLEVVVAVGNRRSERVAEKMGAVREAVLRNRLLLHGQPVDAMMFSVTSGAC